jgi:hypothetical protein
MYVPDVALAKQSVSFGDRGTLFLFEVHDPEKFPCNAEVDAMAREISRDDGTHRNVFFIAPNGELVWRVGNYAHYSSVPDQFVQIWKEESDQYALGWTFRGYKTQINVADGSVKLLEWTK